MSPDQPAPSAMKDDTTASSGNREAAEEAAAAEQALKCPRCDSPNTKFCYYNNYSLTQPRHFCKTCRRYWTKGGALRNVPIGGGCRKNKKIRSSTSSSRLSDSSGADLGPLKFFTSPAMDFQLGGLSSSSYPRPHHQYSGTGHYMTNQFSSSSGFDAPGIGGYGLESSLMGSANYAPPIQEMNNTISSSSLASSIESLSCINQDLHWKLQQQRLAMLFGNGNKDHNNNCTADNNSSGAGVSLDQNQQQTMQPILFQNLDISSKPEVCGGNPRKEPAGDVATEWFFGNSYANQSTGGGDHGTRTGGRWSGAGVQAWSDLQQQNQYTAFP